MIAVIRHHSSPIPCRSLWVGQLGDRLPPSVPQPAAEDPADLVEALVAPEEGRA